MLERSDRGEAIGDEAEAARGSWAPLWVFLLIAFGVPWIGWTLISAGGVDGSSRWGRALFYTGDACSVGGLVAVYWAAGWRGVVDLLRRAVRVRVGICWWLYALFLPMAWQFAARALYGSMAGGISTIHWAATRRLFSAGVLSNFLTGPLGEEFGWRGFLLPWIMSSRTALVSSVIVGVLWGVWHLPLYYAGWRAAPWSAVSFLASVICMSILLTAMFVGTGGNLLLSILMHWTFNASQVVGGSVLPGVRARGPGYAGAEFLVLLAMASWAGWYLWRRESVTPVVD